MSLTEIIDIDPRLTRILKLQEVLNDIEKDNFEQSVHMISNLNFPPETEINPLFDNIFAFSRINSTKIEFYFLLLKIFLETIDKNLFFMNNFVRYYTDGYYEMLKMVLTEDLIVKSDYNNSIISEIMTMGGIIEQENIIEAIKNDDIDAFRSMEANPGFDINLGIELYSLCWGKSPSIYFFILKQLKIYPPYSESCSLIQLSALYGAEKIFRYLFINGAKTDDVIEYGICGGSLEIIQILEQGGIRPTVDHKRQAIIFHRIEIFDWLCDMFPDEYPSYCDILCCRHYFIHGLRKIPTKNIVIQSCIFESSDSGFIDLIFLLYRYNLCDDYSLPFKGLYYNMGTKLFQYLISMINFPVDYLEILINEVKSHNYSIVQYLLQAELKHSHEISLAIACDLEYVSIVKLLLEKQHQAVDFNQGFECEIPLIKACERGNLQIVRMLCEDPGIDINVVSAKKNVSPLFIACQMNQAEIVWYLLNFPNIDVNFYQNKETGEKIYCLMVTDNIEIIRLLLIHPNIRDDTLVNSFVYWVERSEEVSMMFPVRSIVKSNYSSGFSLVSKIVGKAKNSCNVY